MLTATAWRLAANPSRRRSKPEALLPPIPAATAAVSASIVYVAPTALTASPFRITGDSSPVILCPAGRAAVAPRPAGSQSANRMGGMPIEHCRRPAARQPLPPVSHAGNPTNPANLTNACDSEEDR